MDIGDWVRRPRGRAKWHLVESVVADRAVVRCGKELVRVSDTLDPLQVSEVMPLTRMIGQPQLCKGGCEAPGWEDGVFVGERVAVTGGVQVVEDDASTAPTDAPDVP